MKPLDFNVIKPIKKFHENYSLHDIASYYGDEILKKNGYNPVEFGEDRRYERVWEEGKDKPDREVLKNIVLLCLLDWKGKTGEDFEINKRAYESYLRISNRIGVPCWVVMFVIEDKKNVDFNKVHCFNLNEISPIDEKEEWDRNIVKVFSKQSSKKFESFLNWLESESI